MISQIDRTFELSSSGLPSVGDIRLPNPIDPALRASNERQQIPNPTNNCKQVAEKDFILAHPNEENPYRPILHSAGVDPDYAIKL